MEPEHKANAWFGRRDLDGSTDQRAEFAQPFNDSKRLIEAWDERRLDATPERP